MFILMIFTKLVLMVSFIAMCYAFVSQCFVVGQAMRGFANPPYHWLLRFIDCVLPLTWSKSSDNGPVAPRQAVFNDKVHMSEHSEAWPSYGMYMMLQQEIKLGRQCGAQTLGPVGLMFLSLTFAWEW